MRRELPTDTQVRAAMTWLLANAATGTATPTATALAAQVGISRPALYRHYRPLVDELLAGADQQPRPAKHPRPRRDLDAELARVRRANQDLRRHVAIYEEVIRQLTVDNTRLREELDQHAGITRLRPRRHDHGPNPTADAARRAEQHHHEQHHAEQHHTHRDGAVRRGRPCEWPGTGSG